MYLVTSASDRDTVLDSSADFVPATERAQALATARAIAVDVWQRQGVEGTRGAKRVLVACYDATGRNIPVR